MSQFKKNTLLNLNNLIIFECHSFSVLLFVYNYLLYALNTVFNNYSLTK